MIGIAAALGASASWAVGAILFKNISEALSSYSMTLAKATVSVVLLGVATAIVGWTGIDARSLAMLIGSGVLGIAVSDTLFFEALRLRSARDTVILLSLGQVFTILLAIICLHEHVSLLEGVGIVAILAGGVGLEEVPSDDSGNATRWRGIMFGVLSALTMAVSIIIAKLALTSVSALQATFIRMAAGCVGMAAVGICTGQLRKWVLPVRDVKLAAQILVAVSVVTFGGFWLSLLAIQKGNVSINSTLIGTEPLFATIFCAIFLGEHITRRSALRTVLILVGVALLCHKML